MQLIREMRRNISKDTMAPPQGSRRIGNSHGHSGGARCFRLFLVFIVTMALSFVGHLQVQETQSDFETIQDVLEDRQGHPLTALSYTRHKQLTLSDYTTQLSAKASKREKKTTELSQQSGPNRIAIASFVDSTEHVYGVYSIRKQMEKFNMTSAGLEQVVVVPDSFAKQYPKEYEALAQWIGKKYIYFINKDHIYDKMADDTLWQGVFNKLWLFNLIKYDKLILLDTDILIRNNILHWFDYLTPCATQAKDNIEWNSGAMVIQPNTTTFQGLVDMVPRVKRFDRKMLSNDPSENVDNFNSGYGQQGFLSAFFTQESLGASERMKTMPTEASVLISSIATKQLRYFTEFRQHIFETVHFTTAKPWKKDTDPTHDRIECGFRREYSDSFEGIENYGFYPIRTKFLRDCTGEYKKKKRRKQHESAKLFEEKRKQR